MDEEDLSGPERDVVQFYYGLLAVLIAIAALAAWKLFELAVVAWRWVV